MKWEYGGYYKKYNMANIIKMPNNSKVKICDLTNKLPSFMKKADILFIDPPCNNGNLKSYYTKSDMVCNINYKSFYEYPLYFHSS